MVQKFSHGFLDKQTKFVIFGPRFGVVARNTVASINLQFVAVEKQRQLGQLPLQIQPSYLYS